MLPIWELGPDCLWGKNCLLLLLFSGGSWDSFYEVQSYVRILFLDRQWKIKHWKYFHINRYFLSFKVSLLLYGMVKFVYLQKSNCKTCKNQLSQNNHIVIYTDQQYSQENVGKYYVKRPKLEVAEDELKLVHIWQPDKGEHLRQSSQVWLSFCIS